MQERDSRRFRVCVVVGHVGRIPPYDAHVLDPRGVLVRERDAGPVIGRRECVPLRRSVFRVSAGERAVRAVRSPPRVRRSV